MNSEATSWIAFGIASVTMIGGLVKSMIDSRDKKFNTEQAVKVALLEKDVALNREKNESLERTHKECLEHHAETKHALEKCHEGHEANDKRLTAIENAIKITDASDITDRDESERRLSIIEARIARDKVVDEQGTVTLPLPKKPI